MFKLPKKEGSIVKTFLRNCLFGRITFGQRVAGHQGITVFHWFARLAEFFYRARGRLVQLDLRRYEKILAEIGERDFRAESAEKLKERSADLTARARRGVALG